MADRFRGTHTTVAGWINLSVGDPLDEIIFRRKWLLRSLHADSLALNGARARQSPLKSASSLGVEVEVKLGVLFKISL